MPPAPGPIVILGGVLSWPGLYAPMRRMLADCAGVPVSVVRANPADWVLAASAYGWQRILRKLDRAVRRASAAAAGARVVLIGHSSGGVVGRLYLSPEPFRGQVFAGLDRVSHLIMLGSPNTRQSVGPMRRWVDSRFPGAYFSPQVRYTSIAGRWREGRADGTLAERIAYAVYRRMSGNGATWGDGLVPVDVALLPGSHVVVVDRVGHGPARGRSWYGSAEAVRAWWPMATAESA